MGTSEKFLVGVPVKPFGVAKARLAPELDPATRSRLGKAIAVHTVETVQTTGAGALVVSPDPDVLTWASGLGIAALDERNGQEHGLDGAARAVATAASERGLRWAIVHADLPLVTTGDVEALLGAGPEAIAPSYSGGTTAITGFGTDFPFSFGVSSFHRHLAAAPGAAVVIRPGLALDLDTLADLHHALGQEAGAWLRELVGLAPVSRR